MPIQSHKKLFTYWFSVLIYDLTVEFCNRYINSYKLKEQMTGAARSGKQNIIEGSESMKTSLKTAIKLSNVAKASIEELIGDYEDFLRQRNFFQWGKQDTRILSIRRNSGNIVRNLSNLGNLGNLNQLQGQLKLSESPEYNANLILTLCHQASYLLNRQVEALEQKHIREGGYTEKLYNKRIQYRRNI